MKVYAVAAWLISQLDEETRKKAREQISKNGVYSGFHGKWWMRITKSRNALYGQIDQLGVGGRTKLMEDILYIKMPMTSFEANQAKIAEGQLKLSAMLGAEGIPSLKITTGHFNRVAQYRLEPESYTIDEESFWEEPSRKENTA